MAKMLQSEELCNRLSSAVQALCAQVVAAANQPGGLAELDAVVRKAALALGDRVMEAAVAQAAERPSRPVPCPQCARPMKFKQWRDFQIRCVTTGRPIAASSPYLTCAECRLGRLVLRDELGVDRDGLTPALRQAATLAGTLEPYETASETVLSELAGIELSGSKVHGVCQEAGAIANQLMTDGILGQARPLAAGETLYVEADGLMLWLDDGWHEVKLAVVFPSSARAALSQARNQLTERQYVVTQGGPDELGELIWRAAQRWLPTDREGAPVVRGRVVFLSDGAPWLAKMAQAWLPGARVVLDFFHVAEHIGQAARVLHPNDELARRRWALRQRHLLLRGEVSTMLGQLRRDATRRQRSADERSELLHLHDYLDQRRRALCYLLQRAHGLDIGSGPAESAANHVLQQRMKRAGMRWERAGGDAMMALRCAYRSTGAMAALARRDGSSRAA